MRALRNTERVLKNKGVDAARDRAREGRSLKIADIHEQVAGVYPKVMIDGDMDAAPGAAAWWRPDHDVPTSRS
jgi:nitronate monooxygenase